MDTKRLIGEVAKRHGLILDEDDAALVMVTLCQFILEEYVDKMNVNLDRAFAKEIKRASETAEAIVTRAGAQVGAQVAEQIRAGGAAIMSDLARSLDGRAEAMGEQVAAAQRLRRQALWSLAAAAAAAAVIVVCIWRGAEVCREVHPGEPAREHAVEHPSRHQAHGRTP